MYWTYFVKIIKCFPTTLFSDFYEPQLTSLCSATSIEYWVQLQVKNTVISWPKKQLNIKGWAYRARSKTRRCGVIALGLTLLEFLPQIICLITWKNRIYPYLNSAESCIIFYLLELNYSCSFSLYNLMLFIKIVLLTFVPNALSHNLQNDHSFASMFMYWLQIYLFIFNYAMTSQGSK